MPKPDVEIIRHSPGRMTVLLDGKPLPGVHTVSYRETMREAPTVTVELVARIVAVRDAVPTQTTTVRDAVPTTTCDCPGARSDRYPFTHVHLDDCPRRARRFA